MSLAIDAIGAGGALAVAVGSGIQASQAFAELNAQTPLKNSLIPLFWAALRTLFKVVIPKTDVATMEPVLVSLGLGRQVDGEVKLTGEEVKNLKKWLSWYLGWLFISIGALAALAAAAWTIVNDL